MGRLRELLDELRDRRAAEVLAEEVRAVSAWDDEGGSQRVADDSGSRSAPSTSSGTTDSF
jgi:hypothetical protein